MHKIILWRNVVLLVSFVLCRPNPQKLLLRDMWQECFIKDLHHIHVQRSLYRTWLETINPSSLQEGSKLTSGPHIQCRHCAILTHIQWIWLKSKTTSATKYLSYDKIVTIKFWHLTPSIWLKPYRLTIESNSEPNWTSQCYHVNVYSRLNGLQYLTNNLNKSMAKQLSTPEQDFCQSHRFSLNKTTATTIYPNNFFQSSPPSNHMKVASGIVSSNVWQSGWDVNFFYTFSWSWWMTLFSWVQTE